jgi:hypothetical protein
MTTVWPVMVSVRHIVTPISAQSSLSAAFFSSEPDVERSICSRRRLDVARVPSSSPGVRRQRHCHAAREVDEARLRHRISDGRARWTEAGDRRDVDDAASPERLHDGCYRLNEAHGPVRLTAMILFHTSRVRLSRSVKGIDRGR